MNTPSSFDSLPSSSLGNILVVDDEPSILAIATAILNTVSLTPLKAANGETAIEVMEAEYQRGRTVTTAIVDLTMPGGLSGFETMEALKKIDPNIKVIACSGFFQEGALELCQSIGFANILPKPYTPDSFISMIRRSNSETGQSERPSQPVRKVASEPRLAASAPSESASTTDAGSPMQSQRKTSLVSSALARSLQSKPSAGAVTIDSESDLCEQGESADSN